MLVEIPNAFGNRIAILDANNDCIYLYNVPAEKEEGVDDTRVVWIANTLRRESGRMDMAEEMRAGLQPYMPAELCTEHGFILDFEDQDEWEIVWGLEQCSVSVLFRGELVAIMPEWSGQDGFSGYSKGTNSESPIAWPLNPDNAEIPRVQRELQFLEDWNENTWRNYQEPLLAVYDEFHSGDKRYFACDGGDSPPLGLTCSRNDDSTFLTSEGMGLLPMPYLQATSPDGQEGCSRIELGMLVQSTADHMELANYIGAHARYPWRYSTYFAHGHTIPCEQARSLRAEFEFVAIADRALFFPDLQLPDVQLPNLMSSVRLLFMLPISAREQEFALQNTTEELIARIARVDNPLSPNRELVN